MSTYHAVVELLLDEVSRREIRRRLRITRAELEGHVRLARAVGDLPPPEPRLPDELVRRVATLTREGWGARRIGEEVGRTERSVVRIRGIAVARGYLRPEERSIPWHRAPPARPSGTVVPIRGRHGKFAGTMPSRKRA